MPDEQPIQPNSQELIAEIVAAYVRRNQIAADQLGSLIFTVHQAFINLGKPEAETPGERKPIVSARQSVHREYVICMDCGYRGQMLRRHLTVAHGLTTDEYRERWNLKLDHPVTAPSYSERRSTMAKQIGLGRGRIAIAAAISIPEPETTAPPRPKRPQTDADE